MSKYRIQKWKKTITLDHNASTTVVTQTGVELNGVLLASIVKTPAAVDNTATLQVEVIDDAGVSVYTKASLAVATNAQNLLTNDTRVPLSGIYSVKLTYSAAQASDRSADVTLMVDRG